MATAAASWPISGRPTSSGAPPTRADPNDDGFLDIRDYLYINTDGCP
jgi:hypothetical protein